MQSMQEAALASPGAAGESPADFIVVDGLTKSFGSVVAVDAVSFSIRREEIFGLLGPNGAGKSTLIRMLATVLPADAGDATIGGFSVRHQADRVREQIGVCPQEIALYEDLSGLDNLLFFGAMVGLERHRRRERADEILAATGLTEHAHQRVSAFSGGMKRRLNVGVALMGRPALLFLDEPTVGIDPQSRNSIFEMVERLNGEGMCVVYTTHYMEEADRLCDRVAIIDNGRIAALDTPATLKARFGPPEKVTLEEVFLNLTGKRLRD
ncbi:MAG TPA: ATP-binding cassette domain-containing protein [Thermomicrobiaceae bacterium]|nr:ATP-binding cassette domain-containing protein [Thermomicrobiaceae bacterium]